MQYRFSKLYLFSCGLQNLGRGAAMYVSKQIDVIYRPDLNLNVSNVESC